MDNIISWLCIAVVYGMVIMMGALGETINEKSGHLNLGVPGIMYLSAFVSYYLVFSYEKSTSNPNWFFIIIIAIVSSFLVGGLLGLLYSVMCVTFKCNQNVMGLLITSFGVGFGKFLSTVAGLTNAKATYSGIIFNKAIPGLSSIPIIGKIIFGYGFIIYLCIVLAIIVHLFYKKTRIGLNLKAIGESPSTADAVGINVNRYKYISTCIGCGVCGIGGMIYVLSYGDGLWSTNNGIEAIGWLSVALVIFASWKPKHLIWGSILFGLLFWAYNYLPAVLKLPSITGLSELIKMLPYLVTIVILIINSAKKKKDNQPPSSLGLPYYREER